MSNFASKQADLFAGLDSVTLNKDSSLRQDTKDEDRREEGHSRRQRRETDDFKSRESLFREQQDVGSWRRRENDRGFKRPQARSGRGKRKYVKYSLEDVSDVTDRSNNQAAFAFLRELREKRERAEDLEPAPTGGKVVFKKPTKNETPDCPESTSGSGKRVLPEALVGQTSSNLKKRKSSRSSRETSKTAKTTLSHLNFEDEEDDE